MLVLASASPRRQEILRNAGVDFTVEPAHIPEEAIEGESAKVLAQRLAREKALAIAHRQIGAYVLGADTVVSVDDEIFGKPADSADAARMLRKLAGRNHEVITGVCLVPPGKLDAPDTRSQITQVTFEAITQKEIEDYVASGEPMDKAGAYAIQGIASRWISRIEGDYFNVVGLPIALVFEMLKDNGWTP